jgi:two-component system CheB/CheR fusion protein
VSTAEDEELPFPAKSFPIVGIGGSAGGFEAFASFLKQLPTNLGIAIMLVQHLDPTHESLLHDLLAKFTPMPVMQVTNGMIVEPNHVYVIPPNAEMTIHGGIMSLTARPSGAGLHMPIDTFLCSLAEDQKSRAIGIILSGIGSDGTKGLQAIKAEGGVTFAQDEDSSKYSGMPLHAAATGCVDLVLPPDRIAEELARIARHPFLHNAPQVLGAELLHDENRDLRKIFRLIQSATGVDFTNYKQTTILRRIPKKLAPRSTIY